MYGLVCGVARKKKYASKGAYDKRDQQYLAFQGLVS